MSKTYNTLIYESAIIGQMAERIDQMNRKYLDNYMQKKDNWFSHGLFPITERPISKPIKGGILVIGLNPMSMPDEAKKFQEILDNARENGMTPIWDGTDDIHSDQFTTTNWNMPTPRKLGVDSKQGWSNYQAKFNKIWEYLGYPELKNKMFAMNWCPFPSKNESSIKKAKELYKDYTQFTKEYIRLSQPKMIITYRTVLNFIKSEMKWNHTTSSVFTKTKGFIELGTFGNIPAMVMYHPSNRFVSDKSVPDKNDWAKPQVKELIDYFMRQNAIL